MQNILKNKRKIDLTKRIRYVYIIKEIDNSGSLIRFYTGQTKNLPIRIHQHFNGYSNYTSRMGIKRLVFVKYVIGNEFESMREEKKIKQLSQHDKINLIESSDNILVGYFQGKGIVLKKINSDEQILLK